MLRLIGIFITSFSVGSIMTSYGRAAESLLFYNILMVSCVGLMLGTCLIATYHIRGRE